MEALNERICELIETLNIKKTAFAERLNVSQAFISQICSGTKKPSDRTINDICKKFNVHYLWLTEGIGDMFNEFPQTILDELVEEFNLDETDRMILEAYLEAPEDQRKALSNFFQTFAKKAQKMRED